MHAGEFGAYSLFGFLIFNEERCGGPIRLLIHVMVHSHRCSATQANQLKGWREASQIRPQIEDAHLSLSKLLRRFNRGREVDALLEKIVASVRSRNCFLLRLGAFKLNSLACEGEERLEEGTGWYPYREGNTWISTSLGLRSPPGTGRGRSRL